MCEIEGCTMSHKNESHYESNWEYGRFMKDHEVEVEYLLHIDHKDKFYGPYSELYRGSFAKLVALVQDKPVSCFRILKFEVDNDNLQEDFQKFIKLIENCLMITRKVKAKYHKV